MKQDKHLQVLEKAAIAADLYRKGFSATMIAETMMIARTKAYYYLNVAASVNYDGYLKALNKIKNI